jgi:hypothetical protein
VALIEEKTLREGVEMVGESSRFKISLVRTTSVVVSPIPGPKMPMSGVEMIAAGAHVLFWRCTSSTLP